MMVGFVTASPIHASPTELHLGRSARHLTNGIQRLRSHPVGSASGACERASHAASVGSRSVQGLFAG